MILLRQNAEHLTDNVYATFLESSTKQKTQTSSLIDVQE